tara:strand:- start:1449 stop:2525 length:1077 start_codon:yes stop_codon:yes gene_type:complete
MKVYNITGCHFSCAYVRQLLPMWENGYNGNFIGLNTPRKDMKTITQEAIDSDIIVFHRPELGTYWKVADILKGMGKKIVFDNDDTFKLHKGHPFYKMHIGMKLMDKFNRNYDMINYQTNSFIRAADLVTTTTKTLAKEYKELNSNVAILPNCVNLDDWEEPLRHEDNIVRIGISGSTAYTYDFKNIKNYIKELDERDDVQFILFGLDDKEDRKKYPKVTKILEDEYAFWDTLKNKEHMHWVDRSKYNETLNNLKLDIMLIPRQECYFNRCKSNVKFLEAAMCEIPVVASSFTDGPYEELDGKNGIKIKDKTKWKEIVDDLIKNKEKRRAIGKEAKRYVLNNYDIKDHAYKWEEVYKTL